MVMTVSWRKGVNLRSFARRLHRGVHAEDLERTQAILWVNDEGLLAHVGPDLQCGSIGTGSVPAATFSGACEPDRRKTKARHNISDARLRSYATRSASIPRFPISISDTPLSPIRGASRKN